MDLTKAIALMESHHVAPIPVVFEGAVLGMISKAELLAAVERKFVQNHPPRLICSRHHSHCESERTLGNMSYR